MKDMLRTYNEYNKELGYVQGMSDVMAPIYAVLQDDAIAFWGFVRFMDRMVGYIHIIVSIPLLGEKRLFYGCLSITLTIFRSETSFATSLACGNSLLH